MFGNFRQINGVTRENLLVNSKKEISSKAIMAALSKNSETPDRINS
jgi:hypothetical protein